MTTQRGLPHRAAAVFTAGSSPRQPTRAPYRRDAVAAGHVPNGQAGGGQGLSCHAPSSRSAAPPRRRRASRAALGGLREAEELAELAQFVGPRRIWRAAHLWQGC